MDDEKEWNLELSEYIKQGEPTKKEKAKTWTTAIGLQDVDHLVPSEYLVDTAKEHIEGNINIEEAKERIDTYYEEVGARKQRIETNKEADKVSVRITEILSERAFNFSPTELFNIHKRLFDGIFDKAGEARDYNITKKEWVLNNDTVTYSSFGIIKDALEYDFEQERKFSYKDVPIDEAIKHLCKFVSNIWQIHPFCEGNTRTVAVFMIKYLRTFGFNINDEVFANNSWYFRNALVRANYNNYKKNVFYDYSFLEKFFYNLLTNSKYELKSRFAHVDYVSKEEDKDREKRDYSLEEQAILNIISSNPTAKQEDIAKDIKKSLRTVKSYMALLQEKDIIERKNGKRNGEWVVNKHR